MTAPSFVHLHCHSHYSLLDGAAKVKDLVKQAKSQGMNALALTDHGNLYGAVEFYTSCRDQGINPILGYEAYVAPGARTDRTPRSHVSGENSFHLTMLAQNRVGFQNLVKLATYASLEGFYYKPRIDKELLEQYGEGIVILSGCCSSEFSNHILRDDLSEAAKLAEWFAKRFPDRFFIEIQDNGIDIQKQCATGAIEIAQRVGLPLVATCDTHYICSADAEAHEVLLCINTGKTMNDEKRMRYGSDQFYLKSAAEMCASFPNHGDAVAMSQRIADSVDIDLDFKTRHFPIFAPPPGRDDKTYLAELCEVGLKWRYVDRGASADRLQAARDRVQFELGVVNKLGFASYFLIVWDFVNFARSKGIPCGARGSACGALVSYLLGFSDVDPLEFDLLFERFLDPNRAEAPDIDIDFCQVRREEVIQFIREKYGADNVAQIVTFNTMAARAAIKDVSRALEVPLPRVDQITKMIPKTLNITIAEALKQTPELKREYDTDPEIRRVMDIA
ncbi:MAG: DNA polymerase III subunit alpha, partial [Planctomycetia bacterium]